MILFTIKLNQKVVILIDCVRDKQWIKMGKPTMCVRDKHIGRTLWNSLSSKGVYKFCWSNIYMQSDRRTLTLAIFLIYSNQNFYRNLLLFMQDNLIKTKTLLLHWAKINTTIERRWYLTIPVDTITKTRHLKLHSTKWRRCQGLWIDIASIAIVA